MKNLNRISIVLVAVILLSSCGSISISQKRYSRGLNIDLFTHKDEKPQNKKEGVRLKPAARTAFEAPANAETELLAMQPETTPVVEETQSLATEQMSAVDASDANVKATGVTHKAKHKGKAGLFSGIKALKSIAKPQSLSKATSVSKADATHSDVGTLLLVIIAILLPPLAVFLYFGELETNFIISLLLVLLAGGIFLGGGSFFWWTLAVVHALLVVLGMLG